MEKLGLLYITSANVIWDSHAGKHFGSFSKNEIPGNSPGQWSQRNENLQSHKNLYTNVHIRFIYIIAKNQKQPKCSSVVNGLHKPKYIHTRDYKGPTIDTHSNWDGPQKHYVV